MFRFPVAWRNLVHTQFGARCQQISPCSTRSTLRSTRGAVNLGFLEAAAPALESQITPGSLCRRTRRDGSHARFPTRPYAGRVQMGTRSLPFPNIRILPAQLRRVGGSIRPLIWKWNFTHGRKKSLRILPRRVGVVFTATISRRGHFSSTSLPARPWREFLSQASSLVFSSRAIWAIFPAPASAITIPVQRHVYGRFQFFQAHQMQRHGADDSAVKHYKHGH